MKENLTMPAYVEKPMRNEHTIYARCLDHTGSKRLHTFSSVAVPPLVVGMELEIAGKLYKVERVEKA